MSTKIMAVLNLSPDSAFYNGGGDLRAEIQRLRAAGADIIDVGAVSTRPGAEDVSLEQEWTRLERVLDLLEGPVSIDTTRSEIVRRTFSRIGRFIVNDISAGQEDPQMLPTVRELSLPYIAMHRRGNPKTMDALCDYGAEGGVFKAVYRYFEEFRLRAKGIEWILDPGLGFAKTSAQSWELLERLGEFKALGRPILVSPSDKRFAAGDTERANNLALKNGADIIRIHLWKESTTFGSTI